MLGLSGYHHIFRVAGEIIDGEQGVVEQRVSQLLGQRILERLDMDVTVTGLEHVPKDRRYCVVSTHASYLDWAVILGHFPKPVRFIAKKELARVPVIGSYLRSRGVLIDRAKGIDAARAIEAATHDDVPWPILIFPEGTRSSDGRLQPFKPKGLKILAEAGLLMVPVAITGTYDAFPRDALYIQRGRSIALHIGEPVDPGELGVDAAVSEVERRIRALAGA